MKYAWIYNDQIRDISPYTELTVIAECYHPDVAKLFDTLVPDEAKNGDGWVNGEWVPQPEPEQPPEPTPE